MLEAQVKLRVGLFLILAHFAVIVLLVGLYFLNGFLFEEMTTAVALVVPMFAAYTTIIMKHIIRSRHDLSVPSRQVAPAFVLLSFLTPSLFVLLIVSLILLKAMNVAFSSFDDFKTLLALVESAFAVYIGQLVYSLFEPEQPADRTPRGDAPPIPDPTTRTA